MNLLVVGCGRVGLRLVQTMEYLGHDVAIVDENPAFLERLHELSPPFTGLSVRGVPIDVDILRSAGIESCDAVAAVTQDDNINIMVAQMAKEVFHVENVIARVTDPYTKTVYSERFDLRTVCGTNLTANAFVAGLLHGASDDDLRRVSYGSSMANFMALDVGPQYVGQAVLDVPVPRAGMMCFGVWRANGTMELATDKSVLLHTGDKAVYAHIAD